MFLLAATVAPRKPSARVVELLAKVIPGITRAADAASDAAAHTTPDVSARVGAGLRGQDKREARAEYEAHRDAAHQCTA
ncbi:MAG TPA: hypothetical protein VFT29_14855 [Gemmatimonadaceae bacterium]|nr:hypothetical protein [Gemmatimonadaceae bacterium]